MRLALVFPPSMPPTSPPCGIAYLKAFLGYGKTFDANLLYHDATVEMLYKGELPIEVIVGKDRLEPEQLKEAIHFSKGNKNFYDPEEYNRNTSIFFDYFIEVNSYIREQCTKYLRDAAEDCTLDLFDRTLSPVTRYHPDVVGFSQMALPQREFVTALAVHLRKEGIPSVLGGASLWYNPEAYLSEIGTTDYSEIFDVIFYGEGELPLQAYMEGEPLETICNIAYKKSKVVKNRETGLDDLDVLPCPDFRDFPLKEYYTPEIVLPLLTSRGCYWRRCTFCTHYRSYYKYRTRSMQKVVEDLKELKKIYDASYFLLADEMISPSRFNALSDVITKEGLRIRFYSEAKPTKEFTRDLLQKMYHAGVRALLWGVESGTQRVLDVIDKGTKVPDVEKVLKESQKAGIWNMVFMIVNYPTQTKEEIEKDIHFLRRNASSLSTVTGSLFKLEVGSRIYENPEQFGIKNVKRSSSPFIPVCQYEDSSGLSEQEVDLLYKRYSVEFVVLSKVSWYFGKMRDHMLLFADYVSENPLDSSDYL